MKSDIFYCVTLVINIIMVLPFVAATKEKFAMVGTYVPVSCKYNKTLQGKGFYLILSWDNDNALAYMFNNKLYMNEGTAIYKKAMSENFNVDRNPGQEIVLTIQHVKMDFQNLRIICIVKDDEGRGAVRWKDSVTIKVIDPPRILPFANNVINVTRGSRDPVELACAATGYPAPELVWKRRSTGRPLVAQTFDRKTLTARGRLPTPIAETEDETYICEARTSHTYMESIGLHTAVSGVKVNVHYAPTIRVNDQVIYTDIGDTLNVTIELSGNPPPVLECSFLSILSPKLMRVRTNPSPFKYRYEVMLRNVKASYINDYPCRAKNRVGTDTTIIRLRLGPSRPRIISRTKTSYCDYFPLRWTVFSKPVLLNATVQMSTRNSSGRILPVRTKIVALRKNKSNKSVTQSFLYHLTNLTGGTMYTVRVSTCNKYKCSRFSTRTVFNTPRCNGKNKVDRRVLGYSSSATRPSNIRSVRKCRTYGFGRTVCGSSSLQPLSILCIMLFSVLHLL